MKVTFENATIQDAIAKASRVAPTRGEAFDKASGIVMTLDADDNTVMLRSTNLRVFYLEVVDAVEVTGEGHWRFPAALLAGVAAKLPIGTGKHVTFEQIKGEVVMKSGRTTARFRILDHKYYPIWEPFDPDKLEMVPDLGARIKQVEWAAAENADLSYAGIHLNGEIVIATDRFRIAAVPCEAEPIYKPITIPAGILKPVIAQMRDVAVGIDAGQFLLMPDVSTQIRTRIYEADYPSAALIPLTEKELPNKINIRKQALLEIIDRAVIFASNDRAPKLTMIIGKGEVAVMCSDSETGLLGDAVELDGQCAHARHTILFTPKNLTEALQAAPSDEVVFEYDIENAALPVRIDGGSGYVAVVMPRRPGEGDA